MNSNALFGTNAAIFVGLAFALWINTPVCSFIGTSIACLFMAINLFYIKE
jgi:hypothetical protein